MKATFYTICMVLLVLSGVNAQTTILDFEDPATSTTFQYFGSPLDGSLNEIIDNPAPGGINASARVAKFVKPAVAEVWAGAFSNPNPTALVDLTSTSTIRIKVWMDHIGSLSLKLEGSPDAGPNWITTVANTKVNEWEELVFDANIPSIEGPNQPASGHNYARVVLFFDFGTSGTGSEVVSYFDDIRTDAGGASVCNPVLDFEGDSLSTVFQYFGSPLDGSVNEVIDNPNASGINASAKVSKFVKPAVAEVWAGAFSNPNPTVPVNLVDNGKIKIKVHMDHIGNLALKLEGSADGGPNWITTVANTKINEWEELVFDVNLPSIEAPNQPAKGFTYSRIVLFFDFGTAGTGTETISYFDDICVEGSSGPAIRTVNFEVNMNNYSGDFDKVYISGTFNNWAGDANGLTDENADGIWVGSIDLPVGVYEYKVTLDNWQQQEAFIGTEECTVSDPTGAFVNRKLLVSQPNQNEKFCYNSCYACGEEVKISFRLGMGAVTPNTEGVWLAGGGNFDIPGGRYKMKPVNDYYEVVVPRKRSFSSFYAYANGPCGDFSCKEDLTGLSCGNPNNFNDRFLNAVTTDTIVENCYGGCINSTSCISSTGEEVVAGDLFSLSVNPSHQASLNVTDGKEVVIRVSNGLGQIIYSKKMSGYNLTLEESAQWQKGMYLITATAKGRSQSAKWIKL
ncbi:MAG: T9SS type A sorting domain-containing protein [Saprospiraceae bacterium]|nr:T9SS type A sorting domain-containing protein [Saprospiraceae bacterium]